MFWRFALTAFHLIFVTCTRSFTKFSWSLSWLQSWQARFAIEKITFSTCFGKQTGYLTWSNYTQGWNVPNAQTYHYEKTGDINLPVSTRSTQCYLDHI